MDDKKLVTAVNKRTGTEYVLVTDARYGMLRTFTRKGFENINGCLALRENVELYEPVAPVKAAYMLMKICLLIREQYVLCVENGPDPNDWALVLTNKGKEVLGRS